MIITNCQIIYKDRIEPGSIRIKKGKIKEINPKTLEDREGIMDAKGCYLAPGFIDVHIHGAGGYDTMDGTTCAMSQMAKTIMKHGTTSFLPTTMTASCEAIHQVLEVIKELKTHGTGGAHVLGAHLEGPFVSPEAMGAQNPEYLLMPSVSAYQKMTKGCEEVVVSMTLAPELEGAKELIEYASSKGVVCSAGHTKATYEEIQEAISWGIAHSTHLYNAMTGFAHRAPGTVGAIFDSELTTETISDGVHITYPALRVAYHQKGTDKVLLVSDAMMACCMGDGIYALGGQEVIVEKGVARLRNGALAGSVLTLDEAVRKVYQNCGLALYEVVKMATYNPAKFCKVADHKGLLAEGYDADIILLDETLQVKKVWISGNEV